MKWPSQLQPSYRLRRQICLFSSQSIFPAMRNFLNFGFILRRYAQIETLLEKIKYYLSLWRTNLKLRKGFILFMFWEKARKCVCKRKFLEVLPLQCHSCLLNTRRVSLTCVYGVSFFRNQGSLSLRRRRTKRKGEQTIWNVSRWHMIPRRCAESQVHTKKPRKQEIARKIRYIDKVRAKGPRWFYNTV